MKKLSIKDMSCILVLVMLFTMTACGKREEAGKTKAREHKMELSFLGPINNQRWSATNYGESVEKLQPIDIDLDSIRYIYSETERDMKLEKALVKVFDLKQDEDKVRYYYNKVDLNEDGNPEIFAYLVGLPVCGTGGCSAAIFKQENEKYTLLSRFTLVNNPVIISNSKTKGYRDIIMHVYGGGIESFFAWIKYDGKTYPSNPSIQPKVMPGTKVNGIAIIADDITKNPGIELKNLNGK